MPTIHHTGTVYTISHHLEKYQLFNIVVNYRNGVAYLGLCIMSVGVNYIQEDKTSPEHDEYTMGKRPMSLAR